MGGGGIFRRIFDTFSVFLSLVQETELEKQCFLLLYFYVLKFAACSNEDKIFPDAIDL